MAMSFDKPTVELIEEKYYLIANDVFSLSGIPKKLTSEVKADLPIQIKWKGPSLDFKVDVRECFKLLVDIIYDMNEMQDRRFASAPLGINSILLSPNFSPTEKSSISTTASRHRRPFF